MRTLTLVVLVAVVTVGSAPLMRIQKSDGTTIEVPVSSIKGMTFSATADARNPGRIATPLMANVGFDHGSRLFTVSVAQAGHVELTVYSLSGKRLYQYHRRNAPIGTFTVTASEAMSASGIYLVKATITNTHIDRTITICR